MAKCQRDLLGGMQPDAMRLHKTIYETVSQTER
jgi:hypothetical protein